jgi:hypothetical protein
MEVTNLLAFRAVAVFELVLSHYQDRRCACPQTNNDRQKRLAGKQTHLYDSAIGEKATEQTLVRELALRALNQAIVMPDEPHRTDATASFHPDPQPPREAATLSAGALEDAVTLPPLSSSGPFPVTVPEIQVPGYEILGELGRGGMGVVYRAAHLQLRRVVALKMILAGGHAGSVEVKRFLAEAEAVAALQHPNVVQVFDVGSHGQLPYMALEFVGGGSLADRLKAGPLSPRDAARLLEQVTAGVEAAHRKGVVHRDLKPGNVLLTEEGAPKVTDFGLAKRVEGGRLTQTGAVMGTPAYMAPEQARGEASHVGPSADVYALGAILYECLTGQPPFGGDTPLDTILQVIEQDPVPPSQQQPGLPRDLETICLKCLEKDPAKRYASAAALADDLRHWLADEPILARPRGRWERMWRRIKCHRLAIGLVAGAMLLAAAVAGGILWLTPRPPPPPDPAKAVDGFRADMTPKQILERFPMMDTAARLAFLHKVPRELLKFEPVSRGEVRADVVERGEVNPVEFADIVSPLSEKQKSLAVPLRITWIIAEGTAVKAGEKVVVFDDGPLRARWKGQQTVADQAQTALTRAAAERDRTREFHNSTLKLAGIAVEEAQAALSKYTDTDADQKRTLERTVERAQEKHKLAQLQADTENSQADARWQRFRDDCDQEKTRLKELEAAIPRCTLVAPRAGLVQYWVSTNGRPDLDRNLLPGETVLRIIEGQRYEVRINVHEAFVASVHVGQLATVRVDAFPGRVLRGKVRHVSDNPAPPRSRLDTIKVFPVIVALDGNLPELRPGMSAVVTFLGESRRDVLRVPIPALLLDPGQLPRTRLCFRQVGSRVEERMVMVAFSGNTLVEITDGLQEGDLILRSLPELAEGIRRWLNDEALQEAPAHHQGEAPGGRSR